MLEILKKAERIKPVYDTTYKVIMFLCKLVLIGDIMITAWGIAGRYLPFIRDPYWSEEMVLTMMVYLAVLSATLAIRNRAHIRMTGFDKYLSPFTLEISDLIADIAVFLLGIFLLVYGTKLCTSPIASLGKYASIPNLSKFWQYFSIPIAGAGMVIFELEQIFQRIIKLMELKGEKK